jgi:hypothetical protein
MPGFWDPSLASGHRAGMRDAHRLPNDGQPGEPGGHAGHVPPAEPGMTLSPKRPQRLFQRSHP